MHRKRSKQKEEEEQEFLYKVFIVSLILLIVGAAISLSDLRPKHSVQAIHKYKIPQR